jgi:DNA-directed RNA polymerase specialized sigma24 family protein
LGIPVGTVKSRMFNAMKRLREKLAGLENER